MYCNSWVGQTWVRQGLQILSTATGLCLSSAGLCAATASGAVACQARPAASPPAALPQRAPSGGPPCAIARLACLAPCMSNVVGRNAHAQLTVVLAAAAVCVCERKTCGTARLCVPQNGSCGHAEWAVH